MRLKYEPASEPLHISVPDGLEQSSDSLLVITRNVRNFEQVTDDKDDEDDDPDDRFQPQERELPCDRIRLSEG